MSSTLPRSRFTHESACCTSQLDTLGVAQAVARGEHGVSGCLGVWETQDWEMAQGTVSQDSVVGGILA